MGEWVRIQYAPPVPGDVGSTWADLERAARELGYRPRVSLEEGVEATGLLSAPSWRGSQGVERRLRTRA